MKDGLYNKSNQDSLKTVEDLYFANIKHDKDLVWERIDERIKKKRIIPFWIYYTAASILLIFSISFIFNQILSNKNREIAELKSKFELQNYSQTIIESTSYKNTKSDTVKIVQEKIVQLPVNLHDTLVIYDTISQIIVQKDTIILKEKNLEQFNEKKALVKAEVKEIQCIETNKTSLTKKRNKLFKIQFGKSKNENSIIEPKSLISLRTK